MYVETVPSTVRLIPGQYDIPYHQEPPREIRLIAARIGLDREGGLGGEMSPGLDQSDLHAIEGTAKPLQILAYKYRAQATDNLNLPLDPVEVAAVGPMTAYCTGDGCVRFYIKGEVVLFTFRARREAAAYEAALLAHLNRFAGKPPTMRNGVFYIDDTHAALLKGRLLIVVSSWSPTTVRAILSQ